MKHEKIKQIAIFNVPNYPQIIRYASESLQRIKKYNNLYL